MTLVKSCKVLHFIEHKNNRSIDFCLKFFKGRFDNMYSADMTFERHLEDIAKRYPEYEDLYSSWIVLRRVLSSTLENITLYYPHYTSHDASHSETILINLERFLGNNSIQSFSPTDTWMMLVSAYAHDLGMVLRYDEVKSVWKSEEFIEFLKREASVDDKKMKQYAQEVLYSNDKGNKLFDEFWKIIYLTAEFFRKKHAQKSANIVCDDGKKWPSIDFSVSGLIPSRIVHVLGDIVTLHESDFQNIIHELKYEVNGIGTDFLHPRCIAALLRIGDLLDLDNGRFKEENQVLLGPLPDKTIFNMKKHQVVSNFLAKEGKILVEADCDDYETYDTLQAWCNYLASDIKSICLYWNEIMPRECTTKFMFPDINLKLYGNVMSETELYSFHIPVDDVMKLIQGNGMYSSDYTFFREFIINAIDASKLRFWKMVNLGVYPEIKKSDTQICLPDIITEEIAEKFAVEIDISYESEEGSNPYFFIKISDHGIGIDDEAIKEMAKPTKSWRDRDRWKSFIEAMPKWLQPSGEFGVGLHSVFMYVNQISCNSCSINDVAKKIIFNEKASDHKIVYYPLENYEDDVGTTFFIKIPEKLCQVEESNNNIKFKFDNPPMEKMQYMVDWIKDNVTAQIFPIIIKCSCGKDVIEYKIPEQKNNKISISEYDFKGENYYVKIDWGKMKFFVYETLDCISLTFTFKFSPFRIIIKRESNIYFRGSLLEEKYSKYNPYGDLKVFFDGYGAREYLLISRDHILNKKRLELYKKIEELMSYGMRFFFSQIDELCTNIENICKMQDPREYPWDSLADLYDIFLIRDIDEDGKIKECLLKHINGTQISCWKKDKDKFIDTYITLSEFKNELWNNKDVWFICTDRIDGITPAVDSDLKCLNDYCAKNVCNVDVVINAEKYMAIFPHNYIRECRKIASCKYLVSCNYDCTNGIEKLDDGSREWLIYKPMIEAPYGIIRQGLREYQALMIKLPQSDYNTYIGNEKVILSPLGEKRYKNIKDDMYVSLDVLEDEEFKRLVEYVKEHNVNKTVTENEIIEAYHRLIDEFNEYLASMRGNYMVE